jgi:hypothetical protein
MPKAKAEPITDWMDLIDPLLAGKTLFTHNGIRVMRLGSNDECHIRLIAPIDHPEADRLRTIAYDTATSYLSETTNNDACDIVVRERSAHFDLHEDLKWLHDPEHPLHAIVVDAIVKDSLT